MRRFLFDGRRIENEHTPEFLEMETGMKWFCTKFTWDGLWHLSHPLTPPTPPRHPLPAGLKLCMIQVLYSDVSYTCNLLIMN
jgi:hypothetical protein